jgi:hypothetical protein
MIWYVEVQESGCPSLQIKCEGAYASCYPRAVWCLLPSAEEAQVDWFEDQEMPVLKDDMSLSQPQSALISTIFDLICYR